MDALAVRNGDDGNDENVEEEAVLEEEYFKR